MNRTRSQSLFSAAKYIIPGGVNSPVRAFKSVGGDPIWMKKAVGAYLFDEDDNQYIDLINSWGPMIFGHAHEEIISAVQNAALQSLSFGTPSFRELELAQLIVEMVPSIEKVRMVNSGTEATMSAIRLARGYTGKDKIIKFAGCYHGHGDSFLIAAGSGATTLGSPDSPGVTKATALDTIICSYNNISAVEAIFDQYQNQIAAIIVEPVVGNMGCVLPQTNYLHQLQSICNKNHALLIFDEVMTGFRLAKGGAQELFNVKPDITTLGKIIGGGMPVGAYGGKKEIMDYISPQGPVYQAGTLSGNPVSMAAGIAMMKLIQKNDDLYTNLENKTQKIASGIRNNLKKLELNYTLNHIGSMFSLFFTSNEVIDFDSAMKCDLQKFSIYFHEMLNHGVYLAPSQFESLFVSNSLSDEDIEHIINANFIALEKTTLN